ncbi:MAG TPA: hypothetical protein DCP68_02780 [Ruminococcus sp.]|nr:hypothetical protein [Ruminococcus sp.]
MPKLTNAQFWCGMAVLLLMVVAVIAGFLWHWRKIDRDILRDDRKRLTAWAQRYARQLAEQMFREYVRNMRFNIPVRLVNESDINWGERKDGAA